MTPSNPTNNNPFIFRIMDALGVSHLVAPINHTHTGDEISGITSIGEDTTEFTAGITASEGTIHMEVADHGTGGGGGEAEIDHTNIGNLIRALQDPDSAPTKNSDKLITSDAVTKLPQYIILIKRDESFVLSGYTTSTDTLDAFIANCASVRPYPALIEVRKFGTSNQAAVTGFVRYSVVPNGTIYCYITIGDKLMTATGTYSGTYEGDLGTITWGEAFSVTDVPDIFSL